MTRSRPFVIFHIGQHKTGSKALQSFCAHNRHVLSANGVLYPTDDAPSHDIRAYAISQFRLFALVRREALATCRGPAAAEAYWRGQSRFCQPFDSARALFESVEAGRRGSGAGRVVLSAEDLFDMQTAHDLEFSPELVEAGTPRRAELAAGFGYEPRVVVYLRRQDHLLGAHYVQFIKGSSDHDVEFESFSRAFAPRLDTRGVPVRWVNVFGCEHV